MLGRRGRGQRGRVGEEGARVGGPAVGQRPCEAAPPEEGLRRAAAGTAGGRGGAPALKADAGCARGGAVRWLGGRRGRLPNLGFLGTFQARVE